jgi:hypothetical protein
MANELVKPPPAYMREIETLENDVDATHYGMKVREENLERKIAEEKRHRELMLMRRAEVWSTEGLEMLASAGAGALSNVKIGQFPIGGMLNTVLGGVAKGFAIYDPESAPVRVIARAGKTLLHSQVAITTREILRGMP